MTRYIGLLHTGTEGNFDNEVQALRARLPNDVQIISSYAKDKFEQLDDAAAELVTDNRVEVIVAAGGPQSAIAAMYATAEQGTVAQRKPVVFTTVTDPVTLGLVDTLKAPGRNLTGMAGQTSELDPERLAILYEFVAATRRDKFGVLINLNRPNNHQQFLDLEREVAGLGLDVILRPKMTDAVSEIDRAYKYFQKQNVKGVLVTADAFFNNNKSEVIRNAASKKLPTIYQWSSFVDPPAGGLISFGPSIIDAYQQAGDYVTDILQNNASPTTKPCSMPDPNGFEIVVRQRAAQDLGLPIPNTIRGRRVRQVVY